MCSHRLKVNQYSMQHLFSICFLITTHSRFHTWWLAVSFFPNLLAYSCSRPSSPIDLPILSAWIESEKKGYGEKLWRIFCTRTNEPKIQTNCSHQITKFDVNQKRMVFRDMGEIHVGWSRMLNSSVVVCFYLNTSYIYIYNVDMYVSYIYVYNHLYIILYMCKVFLGPYTPNNKDFGSCSTICSVSIMMNPYNHDYSSKLEHSKRKPWDVSCSFKSSLFLRGP